MAEIRNTDDLLKVLKVEEEAWPEEIRASKEAFASRLKIFPEGFFAAYIEDEMVGVSTSQIVNYPNEKISSWEEVTDNGLITSHKPSGNALYVVSIGISSSSQGKRIGTELIAKQIEFAKSQGLNYLVLGARVPEFQKHHQESGISIEDYVDKKRQDGLPVDKELRFYIRNGLKIEKVVPNYMIEDPESLNYGVIMTIEL